MQNETHHRFLGESGKAILRVGLGAVFIIFGLWKIQSPVDWILFLPGFVAGAVENIATLDGFGVLKLMGFCEAVLGIQLVSGMFTRLTGVLCALLLGAIIFEVGMTPIGIRDIGLLAAAVALAIGGGGAWSIDRWLEMQPSAATPLED